MSVVGLLFKVQVPAVLQVPVELFRLAPAQLFDSGLHLFQLDLIVLVVSVAAALKALPRQSSLEQVQEDIT